MFTPTLRHLFHPDNLEEYLDSIRRRERPSRRHPGPGLRARAPAPRRTRRPPRSPTSTSTARSTDLDDALDELSQALPRRRDLVPRADVRRPPELPGRHPGPARRAVRLLGQLLPRHLRPERRRHPHRAPPGRLDRRAGSASRPRVPASRVGPGPTASSPAAAPSPTCRPAAGARHRRRDARRPARPAARPRLRRRPLQRREVGPAARPRRRTPSSGRRSTRSHRMRVPALGAAVAAVPRRRPRADGRRRDGRHHRLRRDRPAPPGRRRLRPASGSGCTSTRRTAAGCSPRRRRRHLLDGIELADSVTIDFHKTWFLPVSASAVIVRDGRTLRHVTHHADYLNPQGRRPTPTRSTRACRPPAVSTRSSSG